jgi:hypothetical protein
MNILPSSISDSGVYLSYFGDFTDQITINLIEIIDQFLKEEPNVKKQSKKIPFLIVECYQNIVRHGIKKDETKPVALNAQENFQILANDQEINIVSVNIIDNKQVEMFVSIIEMVNNKSKDELRELKLQVLNSADFSDKGGAGLGMIEMARKTERPIRFKIQKIDEKHTRILLTLDVVFDPKDEPKNKIETFETYYIEQVIERVLFTYKGDFSKEANKQLVELLETQYDRMDEKSASNTIQFELAFELLLNVAKHGININGRIPGALTIKKNQNGQDITCTNLVDKKNHEILVELIDLLNKSSTDEINAGILKKTEQYRIKGQDKSGIGLYHIAKMTTSKIDYVMYPIDVSQYFFSLKASHRI